MHESEINRRGKTVAFTCQLGFVSCQTFEAVAEGGEDALQGAKHGAEAQVEEHEEEEGRPERAAGQERHGLREGDESQTRSFHTLNTNTSASFSRHHPQTKYVMRVSKLKLVLKT